MAVESNEVPTKDDLPASVKTAATLHNLFANKIKDIDTVKRPDEHYAKAEYFAHVFNQVCYRQFCAQGLDFVVYGLSFKSMPNAIGVAFLAAPRKLASETSKSGEAAAISKNYKLFICSDYVGRQLLSAYRIDGVSSDSFVLNITDDMTTSKLLEYVSEVVTKYTARTKEAYKKSNT